MLGIDLSNYQRDFSEADAQACKAANIGFAFIGRQQANVWAQQQHDFCCEYGIQTAEYLESLGGVWPTLFPDTKYVAFAVEENSGIQDRETIRNCISWIRQQGRIPAAYTRKDAWETAVGADWTEPADQGVLLWAARYRRNRQPNGRVLQEPFGGWTENAFDQYSEVGQIAGIAYQLDLDESDDSLWSVVDAVPEPVLAQPESEAVPVQPETVFVEVPSNEVVALLNDAANGSLGAAIGGSNTIKYLVKKNTDGITFDLQITSIPLDKATDINELN